MKSVLAQASAASGIERHAIQSRQEPMVQDVPPAVGRLTSAIPMEWALKGGVEAMGRSRPNPNVGCVITSNGQILGIGSTQRDGGRHAEAMAIEDARTRYSTLPPDCVAHVTLEPCAHIGRQPPCADLLVQSGIREVNVARTDPFEQVDGRGIARLREAGIDVKVGECWAESTALLYPFIIEKTMKRPCVALKWAQTLDGSMVDASGVSQWITGEEARCYAHALRRKYDAVMVGAGTFLRDRSKLTARDVHAVKQPLRIVWDPSGRLAGIAAGEFSAPLTPSLDDGGWLYVGPNELPGLPSLVLPTRGHSIGKGLSGAEELLQALGQRKIQSLMIEGGASLLRAWVETNLWDVAHVMVAPKWLDRGSFDPSKQRHDGAVRILSNTSNWTRASTTELGEDLLMEFVPESHRRLFSESRL